MRKRLCKGPRSEIVNILQPEQKTSQDCETALTSQFERHGVFGLVEVFCEVPIGFIRNMGIMFIIMVFLDAIACFYLQFLFSFTANFIFHKTH